MNTKITLRRLLSYLNISEFDAFVIKKLFLQIRLRDSNPKRSYFELFFMSIAMWLTAGAFFQAAFLYLKSCETGNFPIAWVMAGGTLFLFFISVSLLLENAVLRRFIWGITLGAQILFLYGVYSFSPLASFACALAIFFILGYNERYTFQQTSTVIVACSSLLVAVLKTQGGEGLFFLTLLTFPIGIIGTLYPFKDIYFQRAARVLVFFAPIVLFVLELVKLWLILPYEVYGAKFVFILCAALFFLFLKKEMTQEEQHISIRILLAYIFGSLIFPASFMGFLLVMLTGWFADFITVFRTGTFLLASCFIVFILSLNVSFLIAACIFTGAVFACLFLVHKFFVQEAA